MPSVLQPSSPAFWNGKKSEPFTAGAMSFKYAADHQSTIVLLHHTGCKKSVAAIRRWLMAVLQDTEKLTLGQSAGLSPAIHGLPP